ncbi:hypothetical protein TMatcc_004878 [Talaromyces marneffei ATCC 18224]|uniref:Uncharacterized protein n=2 Tax=Talaromyces marneffei TaxID=37727 RepID=B6Q1V0_TALMQ|nr:uncharacterized protein EYB26_000199 [Talaromyces marneffei]EEA26834.1 hypothetical protein PMAA_017480 [Talaromyces marneffei ATCC 18224]KAE8557427.1 hypothetical protein EYB25_002134 [Talaromyces marneffei]QGA12555.1 hypothetical protein EYB26_000199 [Talaromyces marneffei]
MTMTSTPPRDKQDESLSQNVPDLEDADLGDDNIVKLLAQLVRKQNDEINKILISQNEQAKQQTQEQRRLSGMIEKLNARLASFLKSRQQCSCDEGSDLDLIPSLRARVDAVEDTLRDHEVFKEVLQPRVERLETRLDGIQHQISKDEPRSTTVNADCLNKEDLQSLTEALATRQLSMQFRIDELADTMNKQISISNEQKPIASHQGQSLSHRSSHSTTTIPIPFERARLGSESTYNCPHHHTQSHSQDLTIPPSNGSISSIESFHQQATSLINKTTQQDASLSSHKKDLLNLKRRLAHAEKLISACYRIGSFSIHGLSFYQDAAALRYISADPEARDAFKMFYGNRIAAIDYADIAPSAILACFDIIARIRCRHDLWTDDKLEAKQRIRCGAEQMVDDWIKSLPLRDGGEHIYVSARELQSRFNQLKVFCYGAGIVFDFPWSEI